MVSTACRALCRSRFEGAFKPVNFFDKNSALDIPQSVQSFDNSTLLGVEHKQKVGVAVVKDGDLYCAKTSSTLYCAWL